MNNVIDFPSPREIAEKKRFKDLTFELIFNEKSPCRLLNEFDGSVLLHTIQQFPQFYIVWTQQVMGLAPAISLWKEISPGIGTRVITWRLNRDISFEEAQSLVTQVWRAGHDYKVFFDD